jgi:hypothetical protein
MNLKKDFEDQTRSCQHLNFGAAEHSVKAKHCWSKVVFSSLAQGPRSLPC